MHKITNELSDVIPASVAMKDELEEEEERNKRDYEEAQRRVAKLRNISKGTRKMQIRKY